MFKEIGKYQSKDGNVRVLLSEKKEMLCDVSVAELIKLVGFKNKDSLQKLMERNLRITTEKFSRIELMSTEGGIQETRLFTERGIVEVAFLAGTKKAEKFRDEIYDLLVSLREKNMVSFGANGLDVKLLEQVKESHDRASSIGAEAIEEIENLNEMLVAEGKLLEVAEMLSAKIEQFEKDREVIRNVQHFGSRLDDSEIEIVKIQRELKKIPEILDEIKKINKKLGGKE